VLCALCCEDLGMANSVFAHLTSSSGLKTPVINFVRIPCMGSLQALSPQHRAHLQVNLTLLTVEKNAAPLYRLRLFHAFSFGVGAPPRFQ
jgi:hypothetical protein